MGPVPGLSPRDRSLVTVAALVALNRTEQLRSHLRLGLQNGLTEEELVEAITQLAFYAGWPCGIGAVGLLRDVARGEGLGRKLMRRLTSSTAAGTADRFTGQVWVDPIAEGEPPSRLRLALVHFAPGAHTAWHRHTLGQILHGADGVGIVQGRDGQTFLLHPGETVHTPPGEWHWHGALPDRFMSHLAAGETTGDPGVADVEWGAHVTAADYEKAIRHAGQARAAEGAEDAQREKDTTPNQPADGRHPGIPATSTWRWAVPPRSARVFLRCQSSVVVGAVWVAARLPRSFRRSSVGEPAVVV